MHITFFGSDAFSIITLKHLQKLSSTLPLSLLCVTRPPKKTGRGRKQITPTPLHKYALGEPYDGISGSPTPLPLMTVNQKQDFKLLPSTDIAVAVSFGLLVPGWYLEAHCRYGGLNVHPSLLPQLAGPAPLHRALLRGLKTTGVSVQTLHPTKFDAGQILMQEEVPITDDLLTLDALSSHLAEKGGEILAKTILEKLYLPENYPNINSKYEPSYAGKVMPEERKIDWSTDTLQTLITRQSVFGTLYTFKEAIDKKTKERSLKRVLFTDVERFNLAIPENASPPGSFLLIDEKLVVKTADNQYLEVKSLKIDGIGQKTPKSFVTSLNKHFGIIDYYFALN